MGGPTATSADGNTPEEWVFPRPPIKTTPTEGVVQSTALTSGERWIFSRLFKDNETLKGTLVAGLESPGNLDPIDCVVAMESGAGGSTNVITEGEMGVVKVEEMGGADEGEMKAVREEEGLVKELAHSTSESSVQSSNSSGTSGCSSTLGGSSGPETLGGSGGPETSGSSGGSETLGSSEMSQARLGASKKSTNLKTGIPKVNTR